MPGMNIAVTGLNATDNPGPGVPVIRSIKQSPGFNGRIVGLLYDTLEPGAYMRDVAERSYLIPYPSSGIEALFERLRYVHGREKLDLLLPTLDTEMYIFSKVQDRLLEMGIRTFLPTSEQLSMRGKDKLQSFCQTHGIRAPKTVILNSVHQLHDLPSDLDYPVIVKGIFYDAQPADNYDEAVAGFNRIKSRWGLPLIIQELVRGDEFNVAALGDGRGGTVGAVAMRKTYVTEKGKGWAGVTIQDPELLKLSRTVIETTKWAGGLELEFIKSRASGEYYLLEINPRFPAWIYLATAAGQNMPAAWLDLALGKTVASLPDYEAGKMFVRCSWDIIADMGRLEQLTTQGEV
jgi:carbamoyl-phosphate synthase large subunit